MFTEHSLVNLLNFVLTVIRVENPTGDKSPFWGETHKDWQL